MSGFLTIDEYIAQCEENLKKFERIEEYEWCAEILRFIQVLKDRNEEEYLHLSFDIKTLRKMKFLKGKTDAEMIAEINTFFGFESIFEYSICVPQSCFYHRTINSISS